MIIGTCFAEKIGMFDIFVLAIFFVSLAVVVFLLFPKKIQTVENNIDKSNGNTHIRTRMDRVFEQLEKFRLYVIGYYEKFLRRFNVSVLKLENFLHRKILSARHEIKQAQNGSAQSAISKAIEENKKEEPPLLPPTI